jgi:hypothetical protein
MHLKNSINCFKGSIMNSIKDVLYDIQELFIDGYTAPEISNQLDWPLEQVVAVLTDFGVDLEDVA